MTEKENLKLGIIGCGFATQTVFGVAKKNPNVKIVAAVDPNIRRAIKFCGRDHAYKDIEKMYKNEDIDVVYIATPPYLHKSMIEEALKENKHIFCEKPISSTIEDAREIYKLDMKYSKLKVGINYQYRYDNNCSRLLHGINNNYLGKIYYANCNAFSIRKSKYFERAKWRAKIETAGGGVLLSFGSHILDVIIYLFGEPSSVIGKIDNLKFKNIEVEDTAFGIIKFQNEIYVQNNCSLITNLKNKEFIESVELNIFGEVGNCYYRGPWPVSSLKWQTTNQFDDKNNNLKESDYSLCFNAFCNWIIYDEPFLNTVEESSKVLMLIKALYKSSKTGKEERIHSLI